MAKISTLLGILLLSLSLTAAEAWPAADDNASADKADKTEAASPRDDENKNQKNSETPPEEKKDPNIFECQYYTVTLPPGWTVITPPTENQGTVTSIFKSSSGSVVIMLVLGNLGGADLQTIADMFAEQFKADRQPAVKNGQYTFTFTRDGKPCTAYISGADDVFMVTTITGNKKEALDFIKKQVKSADFSKLLPQQ